MALNICEQEIEPGSRHFFRMRVASLLNGSDLTISLHVIRGEGDGPVLGLLAGVHGEEYYQNRVIRRLVNETCPDELSGTILAVPVANPIAFSHTSRRTPDPPDSTVDFTNLNRVFPGKRLTPLFGSMEPTDVSLTMKMAAVLSEEVISKCDYIMDFHGHRMNGALKKMLYSPDDVSGEMARIFGLGILHDPIGGESASAGPLYGCTGYAASIGIPGIVPEIGGGGHSEPFERECARLGVHGTKNVMTHLNMIEGEIVLPEKQFYFRRAPHVRAARSGYLVTDIEPEDVGIGRPTREVSKGEVLGTVYNPYTLEEVEEIKSPADGLLYMCRISGLVHAQNDVLAVADYEDSKWIE